MVVVVVVAHRISVSSLSPYWGLGVWARIDNTLLYLVSPFNTLVGRPGSGVPRVYINLSKPGATGVVGWLMRMGANVDFR